jgi:ribA/ribD-fused uncharacterized protein
MKMETSIITSFTGEYLFLSNFYPCPVPFENVVYRSAEHAYQATKTLVPGEREMIRLLETPGQAKRAGRTLTFRHSWEERKKVIMMMVVLSKFFFNPHLAQSLADTGDATLVEGNTWHDNYWGGCTCGRDQCCLTSYNALGKILEAARFAVS